MDGQSTSETAAQSTSEIAAQSTSEIAAQSTSEIAAQSTSETAAPSKNIETAENNIKYILLNKSSIQNPPYIADISNKLLCIEYPGIVENDDKAIETLGGLRTIEMAVGNYNRRLELRYRPKDVFSKPCWGEKDYNPGVLVKIKVRSPKNDAVNTTLSSKNNETAQDSLTTYSYEVIGSTSMTFKFSRLCDFQYLPLVPTSKKKETRNTPCKYIYEDIIPNTLPTWDWFISKQSTSMPLFFAPPIFSRFNTSKDNKLYFERYKYYESLIPEFAEKLKKDALKKKPAPKNLITRSRSERKLHSVFINPFDKDCVIPTEPTKEALDNLQRLALDGPTFKQIQELFAERPIWSKAALSHKTGIRYDRLKFLLPCIGFYFPSGPWRVMWCRFGYDPRLEPSSRIYQTFDFRVRTSDGLKAKVQPKRGFSNILHYKAGPISTEKFSLKDCCLQKTGLKPLPTEDHYILKPDTLPSARQMFYQYCDLHIPEIQNMLKRLPDIQKGTQFDAKSGWLPNGFGDQCREIANRYITAHVKKLLMEDKKRDAEDKFIKQLEEENVTTTTSTEEQNLPSPILILDDDEEDDENPFAKPELYSDGDDERFTFTDDEVDLQIVDIEDTNEELDLEAVNEINKIIVDSNNDKESSEDEDSEEELPSELQKLYYQLISSKSGTKK